MFCFRGVRGTQTQEQVKSARQPHKSYYSKAARLTFWVLNNNISEGATWKRRVDKEINACYVTPNVMFEHRPRILTNFLTKAA